MIEIASDSASESQNGESTAVRYSNTDSFQSNADLDLIRTVRLDKETLRFNNTVKRFCDFTPMASLQRHLQGLSLCSYRMYASKKDPNTLTAVFQFDDKFALFHSNSACLDNAPVEVGVLRKMIDYHHQTPPADRSTTYWHLSDVKLAETNSILTLQLDLDIHRQGFAGIYYAKLNLHQ